jgi:predicted Zn-dependent protease
LLVRLARCHGRLDQAGPARRLLEAVLADHPDDGRALLCMGQLEMLTGRLEEAEARLRQAARALPHDYTANWALAECLRREKKDAEAAAQRAVADGIKERRERIAEITKRQLSARPHDPALCCELGTLFLRTGSEGPGERWLLNALRYDPHYGPAHAALADYYDRRGDAGRAAYHRRQAQGAPPPSAAP